MFRPFLSGSVSAISCIVGDKSWIYRAMVKRDYNMVASGPLRDTVDMVQIEI